MEDRRLPHYLPGTKTGARVGNLKLDLPVDEDDYLMPSPQSTQPHHGGYMDLIGDAKLGGMCIFPLSLSIQYYQVQMSN